MEGAFVAAALAASWVFGVSMGWVLYGEVLSHNAKTARRRRALHG
jgi:hypothetical protein